MNDTALRLADDLSQDYCHCHEGFKGRGLVDPYCESCNTGDWRHQAAAELRRLHDLLGKANALCRIRADRIKKLEALNAELVEALRWIDMRCPAILLDHPLHRGLHMEAAYDAGACARAALEKVEASK